MTVDPDGGRGGCAWVGGCVALRLTKEVAVPYSSEIGAAKRAAKKKVVRLSRFPGASLRTHADGTGLG